MSREGILEFILWEIRICRRFQAEILCGQVGMEE